MDRFVAIETTPDAVFMAIKLLTDFRTLQKAVLALSPLHIFIRISFRRQKNK